MKRAHASDCSRQRCPGVKGQTVGGEHDAVEISQLIIKDQDISLSSQICVCIYVGMKSILPSIWSRMCLT